MSNPKLIYEEVSERARVSTENWNAKNPGKTEAEVQARYLTVLENLAKAAGFEGFAELQAAAAQYARATKDEDDDGAAAAPDAKPAFRDGDVPFGPDAPFADLIARAKAIRDARGAKDPAVDEALMEILKDRAVQDKMRRVKKGLTPLSSAALDSLAQAIRRKLFVTVSDKVAVIGALKAAAAKAKGTQLGDDCLKLLSRVNSAVIAQAIAYSNTGLAAAGIHDAKARKELGLKGRKTTIEWVKSGTPEGIAKYGRTAREADRLQLQARLEDGYTGEGAYFGGMLGSRLGSMLPGGLGVVGSALGGRAGSAAEDWLIDHVASPLMSTVGDRLKRYRGEGAYVAYGDGDQDGFPDDYADRGERALTNTLINPGGKFSRTMPRFYTTNDEEGVLVFSHCENLGDFKSASLDFHQARKIECNPGLIDSFPWMAQIAKLYHQYNFEQLIFAVEPLVTEGNPAAQGTAVLAVHYDVSEGGHLDKRSALSVGAASVSDIITKPIHLGVECKDSKNVLHGNHLVRTTALPETQKYIYDNCYVELCYDNVPVGMATSLWVSYKVKLSKPKMNTAMLTPLEIGEGMSYAVQFSSMHLISSIYNGWGGSRDTDNPVYPNYATFPANNWTTTTTNGIENLIVPARLYDDDTFASGVPDTFTKHILAWTKSPNLLYRISPAATPDANYFQFMGVADGVYEFVIGHTFRSNDGTTAIPVPAVAPFWGTITSSVTIGSNCSFGNGSKTSTNYIQTYGTPHAAVGVCARAVIQVQVKGTQAQLCELKVQIDSTPMNSTAGLGSTFLAWSFHRVK